MPNGQEQYVHLPNDTYVRIPADATPEQLAAFRTKLRQKFPMYGIPSEQEQAAALAEPTMAQSRAQASAPLRNATTPQQNLKNRIQADETAPVPATVISNKLKNYVANEEQRGLVSAAQGKPTNVGKKTYGPRVVSKALDLGAASLEPSNAGLAAGIALANTNPVTGIPADLALLAHGGYGMLKNAPGAIQGNPENLEQGLLAGSEATGGLAGTGAQIRTPAVKGLFFTDENKFKPVRPAEKFVRFITGQKETVPLTQEQEIAQQVAREQLVKDARLKAGLIQPPAPESTPISEGPTAGQHKAVRAAQQTVANRNARQLVPRSESPNAPEPGIGTPGTIAQEAGYQPPLTKIPIRPEPPSPLTPEQVPGPDTSGKGNLLTPAARRGDARAGQELQRRGRRVLYVPAEEYPAPRSSMSFSEGGITTGAEPQPLINRRTQVGTSPTGTERRSVYQMSTMSQPTEGELLEQTMRQGENGPKIGPEMEALAQNVLKADPERWAKYRAAAQMNDKRTMSAMMVEARNEILAGRAKR